MGLSGPGIQRPRVLAVLPGFIPSTLIHIVKPLAALHRCGWIDADIMLEHSVFARHLERADVVVFCRNTEPAFGWILDFALARCKPVIYDLDDNFFEIPLTSDVARYHRAPERLQQLTRYLTHASLVRVYSEALRERVSQLNTDAVAVDGPVDWSLIPSRQRRRNTNTVRMVYPTSRVVDDLAGLFLDDIERLLTTYAGRLEIFFWGYHPRELCGHPAVRFLPFIANYDQFFRQFASSGFDVGLAPLRNDAFHRSKSDLKFREYAACRIVGVYSNVGAYARVVEDGVTGLLVSNRPGAWFDAVGRLIEDLRLRQAIEERAREYARSRYDLRVFQNEWWGHLRDVMGDGRGTGARRSPEGDHLPASTCADRTANIYSIRRWSVAKLVWAYWAGRPYRFIHALRRDGFPHVLDRVRWYRHNLSMLFQVRMGLRFWSVLRTVLPRPVAGGPQKR